MDCDAIPPGIRIEVEESADRYEVMADRLGVSKGDMRIAVAGNFTLAVEVSRRSVGARPLPAQL